VIPAASCPTAERTLPAVARIRSVAAQLELPVTIVAGQHGYLTGKWQVGAKLRGRITDADADAMERLSSTTAIRD
jgi:hypothetical protein